MQADFDWKKLQNSSDIRGVALEGVPNEIVNLTPDIAEDFRSIIRVMVKSTIWEISH